MWAHGTVGVAAGTRGVTCRHAAQTGRCLGGIGGKELLGGLLELLVGLKRCLVPTSSRQHLLAQLLTQLREHNARLHAQQKLALFIAAKAQVAIHTGSIEDMPAVGHGTGRQGPGSGALNRYRDTLGMELFQNGTDLVFRCRKRDARGLADARDSSRPYSSNSSVKGLMVADTRTPPLANYSVCREMLSHRFVDVFETVSIIGDFYVRAIRRAA